MKKLMVILAIVVSLALVAVGGVRANSTPVIDGVISPSEWDAYHLGTSETGWVGGMSVEVYGFADDTYLYVAYDADTSQPGWAVACGLWVDSNFVYRTPQTSWPEPGYTMFQMWDDPPSYSYTDGTDWVWPRSGYLDDVVGLEYAYVKMGLPGCETGANGEGVAELKIPLSLLTYAGADDKIAIGGQYWQYDWATPFLVPLPPSVIEVPVDIKPGSCPNPLNVKEKGVLPIAILGTSDFDVTQVDPASVRLEGVAPLRWSLEDVATPFEPFIGKEDAFDCTDEGPDGFLDLTLKFDAQEIVAALGDVNDGDVLVLTLTGNLLEEFDGTPIQGEDVVVILEKGEK